MQVKESRARQTPDGPEVRKDRWEERTMSKTSAVAKNEAQPAETDKAARKAALEQFALKGKSVFLHPA